MKQAIQTEPPEGTSKAMQGEFVSHTRPHYAICLAWDTSFNNVPADRPEWGPVTKITPFILLLGSGWNKSPSLPYKVHYAQSDNEKLNMHWSTQSHF